MPKQIIKMIVPRVRKRKFPLGSKYERYFTHGNSKADYIKNMSKREKALSNQHAHLKRKVNQTELQLLELERSLKDAKTSLEEATYSGKIFRIKNNLGVYKAQKHKVKQSLEIVKLVNSR